MKISGIKLSQRFLHTIKYLDETFSTIDSVSTIDFLNYGSFNRINKSNKLLGSAWKVNLNLYV